uniref:NAD(P)/FAD-dependent oxidoreductase n=1 Tax=Nocardioides sp. R-C-SC26 TaxID=2870414 RepID=UPI001E52AD28
GTPEGLPSQRTVDYFAARAAGGTGLITVGATGVDHRHPETPGGLQLGTDDSVAAHRRVVDAVHAHGARIQPQIVHAGPDGLGPEMFGVDSLGPSVIPSYLTGRPSQEATPEQIREVLGLFRAAIVRAREAGYDGIELHAAHGYMFLGSFLAPQRNRRTDDYRGDRPSGRFHALLEALGEIRDEVGADFPITLRVSGYERVAGGRPMYELAQMAPLLVEAGVDAFHVSGGVIDRLVTQMVNGASDGAALNVGAAATIKQAVDVPVIAVGRIHDPVLAERILAEGRADFVAMGRPMLADPDLPRKLAAGQAHRVRQCISCQNCIDSLEQRFSVDCAVNPRTGREAELDLTPVAQPREVLVIGGGPAGLEAARVAALRGHRVRLAEATEQLGGAFVAASQVHPENSPYLRWLTDEVGAADIDVRLGTPIDPTTPGLDGLLASDDASAAVVVATGGERVYPDLPGAELPHVHRGHAISAAHPTELAPRSRVVVVGAELAGVEAAEVLARAGHLVTLVETRRDFAPHAGWKRKTEHMDALDRLGVTFHVGAAVEQITTDGVVLAPRHGPTRTLPADAVLLTGEVAADSALADALRAAHPGLDVVCVGDADGFGMLHKAALDGVRAGCAL